MKKLLLIIMVLSSFSMALTFPIDLDNCIYKYGRVLLTGWYNQKREYGKHKSLDIPAVKDTPVRAVKAGEIIEVTYASPYCDRRLKQWRSNYGNYIKLRDNDGNVWVMAHLNSYVVQAGQRVSEGQVIGRVGSTGIVDAKGHIATRAYHLHIECRSATGRYISTAKEFGRVIKHAIPDQHTKYAFSLRN